MITIRRNGVQTTITGWREWLMVAVASVIAAVVLVTVFSLVIGVAVTVLWILIVTVPIIFVLALILQALQPKR